jgi:hypothetical protein
MNQTTSNRKILMASRLLLTLRAGLLVGLGSAVGTPVVWLALGPASRLSGAVHAGRLDRLPFEAALTGLAAGVAVLGSVWLVAVTVLAVLTELLGAWAPREPGLSRRLARCADRLTPRLVRGVVTASLGVALTAGVAPANADVAGTTVAPPGARGLTGLPLPDRTTGGPARVATSGRTAPRPVTVVVRAGDSLWSIVDDLLPRDHSCARTAQAVRRLYAANRPRIGDDPDLIRPGARLVLPQQLLPIDRRDHS